MLYKVELEYENVFLEVDDKSNILDVLNEQYGDGDEFYMNEDDIIHKYANVNNFICVCTLYQRTNFIVDVVDK